LQVDSGTEIVLTSTNPNTFWNGCDSPANGQTPSGTCRVIMTADRTVRVRLTQFSGTAFQANVQTFSTGALLRAAAARTKQNNEK
jgi:hypothetical protein